MILAANSCPVSFSDEEKEVDDLHKLWSALDQSNIMLKLFHVFMFIIGSQGDHNEWDLVYYGQNKKLMTTWQKELKRVTR